MSSARSVRKRLGLTVVVLSNNEVSRISKVIQGSSFDHYFSGFFLADLLNRLTKNLIAPIAVDTPVRILFTSFAS